MKESLFPKLPNFRCQSVLGIQITCVLAYSLPFSGLIEMKTKTFNYIIFMCMYAVL